MIEHLEKSKKRYVIATFDNPTNYVVAKGNCNYSFIDNIVVASKFVNQSDAYEVRNSLVKTYDIDLVVLPMRIDYILLEDE